jgi:hypothetical protein
VIDVIAIGCVVLVAGCLTGAVWFMCDYIKAVDTYYRLRCDLLERRIADLEELTRTQVYSATEEDEC